MRPIFENFHKGLIQVHQELRHGAQAILDLAAADPRVPGDMAKLIAVFSETLLNHHKSEDAFFFPAFRAAGRLRSSDIAFLDARDAEHVGIHRLCVELRDLAARHERRAVATPNWYASTAGLVAELRSLSLPHFESEERALTPAHVADLISEPELAHIYRDMGENWHRR